MSKIFKNNTASALPISEIGSEIPASGQLTIDPSDYQRLAASEDAINILSGGTPDATYNDGSNDLSLSDAIDHIKGVFPKELDTHIVGEYIGNNVKDDNSFSSLMDFESISGTTEHDLMLVKNPASSGKNVMITHFAMGADSTSARSIYRTYRNPTITSDGTALSVFNCNFKTSPESTVASVFKNPTISTRGGLINIKLAPANGPSLGLCRTYWLPEGSSLLVTVESSISSTSIFSDVYWVEVDV